MLDAKIIHSGKLIGQVNNIYYRDGGVFVSAGINAEEKIPRGSSFHVNRGSTDNLPYIDVIYFNESTDFFENGDTTAGTEIELNLVDKIKADILRRRDSIFSDTLSISKDKTSDSLLNAMKKNLSNRYVLPDELTQLKISNLINQQSDVKKLLQDIAPMPNVKADYLILFDNEKFIYTVDVGTLSGIKSTKYFSYFVDPVTYAVSRSEN